MVTHFLNEGTLNRLIKEWIILSVFLNKNGLQILEIENLDRKETLY